METWAIEQIANQDAATRAQLLDLNNANAHQTSFLTKPVWDGMVENAFAAICVDPPGSLLIAFDQDAELESPNFTWFRSRLLRFVYVDRIVVGVDHRGQGIASRLYDELFKRALAAGHDLIACEVNLIPPNPQSDAFHARMGFCEVGRATQPDRGKTVRYLTRSIV